MPHSRPYWFDDPGVTALLSALRSLHRADEQMRRRMSAGMDMNARDMEALQHLIAVERAGGSVTPRMLASHLGISTASTTKLVDRLAESGHLARSPHPVDRRSVVVRATPHAHQQIRERLGAMHERMGRVAAGVPQHCRAATVEFLRAMSAELDRAGDVPGLTPEDEQLSPAAL